MLREKSLTEDIDLIELTPLDDFDLSLLESGFESNLDVLVPINDDDDLFEQGILMEDSETDDLVSEQEANIDFDQILSTLPENLAVDFPPNFVASMFFKMIEENCFVDPDWDTSERLSEKEAKLLESLKDNPKLLSFIKIQWHHLVSVLNVKDQSKNELYEQKELTVFCSNVFSLATGNIIIDEFSALLDIDKSSFSTEHYTCCSEIVFNLATIILQTLASKMTGSLTEPFKSLDNMTSDEKGKIRYVGGWALKKSIEKAKRYIETNITSVNPSIREQLKHEIMKLKITESLLANSVALDEHSEYQDSLTVIDNKQNRSQGLLNIADNTFLFFTKLEECRVNLLTRNKLNMLKGDMAIDCMANIRTNVELKNMWQNMFDGSKELFGEEDEIKISLFEKCGDVLFGEVIKAYVRMGIGEFLRDFQRDIEWKKAEAHRKKVQMRTEKKEQKAEQVKIVDIKDGQTPGKKSSHTKLRAMLLKYLTIFNQSRLYVKKDIKLLLRAYGVSKKGTKSALADKLVEVINSHEEMVDTTVFE